MKFSLISDMHVNHPQLKTPYDKLEPLVVVAGDTSNGLEGLKFLDKLRRKGHDVVAVDGNHEHYSNVSSPRSAIETVARFRQDFPDVSKPDPNGPWFLCRNGWYFVEDEPLWYNYMNDGRFSGMDGETVNSFARQDIDFMRWHLEALQGVGDKAVVVTHTSPCTETLNKEFAGHYSNDWYWNPGMKPLLEEYSDTILVWCHGHTHAKADTVIGGTRVVCNPRGYPGENPNWEPLTIEV